MSRTTEQNALLPVVKTLNLNYFKKTKAISRLCLEKPDKAMGVNGLWSLLSDVKQEVHLSQCCGKKLAVDLSSWLVSCAQISTGPSKDYLRFRSVFFRIVNLLSLGITPVFVMDSKDAPPSKKRRRGDAFYSLTEEYKVFLKALGVPVVQSPGEAEKMCAELDQRQIVDGCLTNDGDVFVYGAKTVYKGFVSDKQDLVTHKYEMTNVESELGLSRNDLIAFALLSGSDMCDGIRGIGEVKFMELVQELHRNGVTDILERIQSWKTNEQLIQLTIKSEELKTLPKGVHCSRCCHEGTLQRHKKIGCCVCSTPERCLDAQSGQPGPPCPCRHHTLEATVKQFKVELKTRTSAMQLTDFPSETVTAEYLHSQAWDNSLSEVTVRLPDFHQVFDIIGRKLNLTSTQTLSHLVPALIRMHLHGFLVEFNPQPLEILKTKMFHKEHYYIIKWKPLPELQEFKVDECFYEFDVLQDLFQMKYGEMAHAFNEKKLSAKISPKKRRLITDSTEDKKQPKITDMFQVRKSLSTKDVLSKS